MISSRRRWYVFAAVLLALAACSPEDTATPAASSPSASASSTACAKANLKLITKGTLTVGTDKPAFEPWFKADNPANGQGFESAVAYAVAAKLGFEKSEVVWVTVPFNSSYAPGRKKFDFDINQISVTDARKKVVDFSSGYFTVTQAVVALTTSTYANAKTIADLKNARFGAQIGTTSLQAVDQTVQPTRDPRPYNDNNDTKTALQNGTIDAAVFDLPTALYLVAAEIEGAKIVGQFPTPGAQAEQFGMLFEKGNTLTGCVDQALASLRTGGELAKIQQQWLTADAGVPELK